MNFNNNNPIKTTNTSRNFNLNSNNTIINNNKNNNNKINNGSLLTKSNYTSNILSNISNPNNISINFNSYLKSENLNSLNKSNELNSPKNTFAAAPQTQMISTNRELKDFVNLYSKNKFFKNPKFQVKSREENNLGFSNNLNVNVHYNNNNINNKNNIKKDHSNCFLSENIFNNDYSLKNMQVYANNKNSNGVRFKSLKIGSDKLLDFE